MEKEVGVVTHFYKKIGVGIVELTQGGLKVGDTIRVLGKSTDFTQTVESMEIEHQKITEAQQGQVIGLKLAGIAREGDKVFLVVAE
ncbi:MAG: EF-Tu/IF-2/RF-3 family GTPase [bacterium JZ-2024 1]